VIGETISHYRITEKLGEGGMGVVYKAEDTKLERTVALKFLAAHLLNDDEAKQRFLREAKAAASLQHANICPVYEIDDADGKTFISMAFIEGETLEERIAKGPLPIKDALDIGQQIAKGLHAAHEKGIVHRDIKPANVLVAQDGQVTIMDFGLARLTEASRLTKVDQTMGTVAYMSPEQVQGMEVDHRSDIWALGCVLYEMVRGQRPFQGQYDQALFYEIVQQEPDPLTSVRADVPMELEFIAGKCLAKDRDDRTASAQEVARELRTLGDKLKSGRSTILRTANLAAGVPATLAAGQTVHPAEVLPPDAVVLRRSNLRLLQALAAVATLALLGVLAIYFTRASPEPSERVVRRFSFALEGFARSVVAPSSISPDGKHIAYRVESGPQTSLWLRSLATETSRELSGTEGAFGFFWSPDSASLGFFVPGRVFELKRVSIDGGNPITLCEFPSGQYSMSGGGTWSPDGERIVFSSGRQLYEIAARGGQPQLLLDPGDSPRPFPLNPHFLPADGGPAALVYTAAASLSGLWVAVLNLETGEQRELGPGREPVYSPEGYLIHGTTDWMEPGLFALPFSRATLEPAGEDFPISAGGAAASLSRAKIAVRRSEPYPQGWGTQCMTP
jgi:predicted Ser/Thr protein kinase